MLKIIGKTSGVKDYNENAIWINELESNYCSQVNQKTYKIDNQILEKVIAKIQNGKAPGPDGIIGYWYKKLYFYRDHMAYLFQQSLEGKYEIPAEMVTAKTVLLPKNTNTHIPKNYRPIACLNLMYKLHTSCINMFIQDHCESNGIITNEQAAGKKNVWGCTEQLMVNKIVLNEVRKQRRNLYTVWLDYAKAFDSISHSWMLQALRLAKIPENIVIMIEKLSKLWPTIVTIKGDDQSILTKEIKYFKGIFQGDSLSVILFILCLNPLSYLINNLKGYAAGKDRNVNITHNFFVDDLKLYSSTLNGIKKQLDLVTTYSNDIGMQFGQEKCAYLMIEKGKIKSDGKNIVI